MSYLIDTRCPECGDPKVADSNDIVVECDGCGTLYDVENHIDEVDEDDHLYQGPGSDDWDDGPDFQDPGGNSALRRATESNPRNLPCPTCGCANRLTPADVDLGYQCDACADRAERGGW